MDIHQVTLTGRERVAEGTMAFRFSKPDGFLFKPGQAIDLELLDAPAEPGHTSRTFSLVSAPFERELEVATRMRDSGFKNALKALPVGARVRIYGPYGEFTLCEPGRHAVFIAGGIGITPFMSMLRLAARDRPPQRLALAYSNRRPEDSAFLDELQELERQNKNFRLMATMTDMGKSVRTWGGATGYVSAEMLTRLADGLGRPLYYVVGPPAMVEAMLLTLDEAGIAKDMIRTEEFYGY